MVMSKMFIFLVLMMLCLSKLKKLILKVKLYILQETDGWFTDQQDMFQASELRSWREDLISALIKMKVFMLETSELVKLSLLVDKPICLKPMKNSGKCNFLL